MIASDCGRRRREIIVSNFHNACMNSLAVTIRAPEPAIDPQLGQLHGIGVGLPPGVEGIDVYEQLLFAGAAGTGILSSPTVISILHCRAGG